MTDIAADDADPARLPRPGRGGGRSSARSRSGTGRRSPATSATPRRPPTPRRPARLRRDASSWPARTARDGSRSTRSSSARASTTLARGELVTAIELPRPAEPARRGPCPADAAARSRSRLGDAGLRGPRRRHDPAGLRQPRAAAGPRHRRDRACSRIRRAPERAKTERLETLFVGGQPVGPLDAGEPGVPARDAPRPRPSGGRRSRSSGSQRARRPMTTTLRDRADRQRPAALDRGRAAPHAARGPARRSRPDRHEGVLPRRRMRRVHRDGRRRERRFVPDARGRGRRRDRRRPSRGWRPATARIRSSRRSSTPAPRSAGSASRASSSRRRRSSR